MLIRHCNNCNRIYQADRSDRQAFVCRYCSAECENVLLELRKLSRRIESQKMCIQDLPMEELVKETHASAALLEILLKEKHFQELDKGGYHLDIPSLKSSIFCIGV